MASLKMLDLAAKFEDGRFAEALNEAVKVRIQNVADYYYQTSPQENWNLRDDFPDIAPPWPLFWMEYRSPSSININGRLVGTTVRYSIGMLVAARDRDSIVGDEAHALTYLPSARWTVVAKVFLAYTSPASAPSCIHLFFWVDRDGRFITIDSSSAAAPILLSNLGNRGWPIPENVPGQGNYLMPGMVSLLSGREPSEHEQNLVTVGWAELQVACLALSFCNCNNVTLRADEVPEKLRKKSEQRGRVAVDRWHLLEIGAIRRTLNASLAGEAGGSLKQALHICRGNWAEYKPDRPLFGKQIGRFWRPMHTRGALQHGTVEKDYSVQPPKE
jgi:hypothetical protein